MALQKLQDHILESLLPTKLTTLIMGSTISLTLLSIGLPNFLQTLDIQLSAEKTLLLRITAPLGILCVGTLIVLLLVVRHCNHIKITQNQQPLLTPITSKEEFEEKAIVTDTHEKVMEMLFQKPSTVENICKTLNLTKEETNFYLFDLYKHSMVSAPAPYASGPEEWRICQGGREYITDKRKSA